MDLRINCDYNFSANQKGLKEILDRKNKRVLIIESTLHRVSKSHPSIGVTNGMLYSIFNEALWVHLRVSDELTLKKKTILNKDT